MASDSKIRTETEILAAIAELDSKQAHDSELAARVVASFKADANEYLNQFGRTCASLPDASELEPVRRPLPSNNTGPAIEILRGVVAVLVMANIEQFMRVLAPAIPTDGIKTADRARRRSDLLAELKTAAVTAERSAEKIEGTGYVPRAANHDPPVFLNFQSADSWDRLKFGKVRRHFIGTGKNLSEINNDIAICRSEIVKLRAWESSTPDTQQRETARARIQLQEARLEPLKKDLATVQREADEANKFLANLEKFLSDAGAGFEQQ